MRFIALILCALLSWPASAQVAQTGAGLAKPSAGGGGTPTLVVGANVALQNPAFAVTTITFTGLNGGVNFPAGSTVVVAFFSNQGVTGTSPLIGGVAATQDVADPTGTIRLYHAQMVSSSADTFSVVSSGNMNFVGAEAVYMTNVNPVPTTTATLGCCGNNPQTVTSAITVPSTGFGIVGGGNTNGSGTPTWVTSGPSNITSSAGDINVAGFTNYNVAMAHTATAGSNTPSVSWVAFGASLAAATWGP